ncbi:unnamed protein product, partial [Nesidiocoris tenuis]
MEVLCVIYAPLVHYTIYGIPTIIAPRRTNEDSPRIIWAFNGEGRTMSICYLMSGLSQAGWCVVNLRVGKGVEEAEGIGNGEYEDWTSSSSGFGWRHPIQASKAPGVFVPVYGEPTLDFYVPNLESTIKSQSKKCTAGLRGWASLLLSLTFWVSSDALTCGEARLKCAYREGCGMALQRFLMSCSNLHQLNKTCPEECKNVLIALMSTDEGQEFMSFQICHSLYFKSVVGTEGIFYCAQSFLILHQEGKTQQKRPVGT